MYVQHVTAALSAVAALTHRQEPQCPFPEPSSEAIDVIFRKHLNSKHGVIRALSAWWYGFHSRTRSTNTLSDLFRMQWRAGFHDSLFSLTARSLLNVNRARATSISTMVIAHHVLPCAIEVVRATVCSREWLIALCVIGAALSNKNALVPTVRQLVCVPNGVEECRLDKP